MFFARKNQNHCKFFISNFLIIFSLFFKQQQQQQKQQMEGRNKKTRFINSILSIKGIEIFLLSLMYESSGIIKSHNICQNKYLKVEYKI